MRPHKLPTTTIRCRRRGADLGDFAPSGDDVGEQLALDLRYLVLEQQLSLLQSLQFELVERSARGETRDHFVEIAVFGFQRGELCSQSFDVEVHGRARRFSIL